MQTRSGKRLLATIGSYEMLCIVLLNSGVLNQALGVESAASLVLGIAAGLLLIPLGLLRPGQIRANARILLLYAAWLLYVCLTYSWAEPTEYAASTLFLLTTISQILLGAGIYIGSRQSRLRRFMVCTVIFNVGFCIPALLNVISSGISRTLFYTTQNLMGLNYQTMSFIAGQGIIALLLLRPIGVRFRHQNIITAVLLIMLLVVVLGSGGRGGLLISSIALAITLLYQKSAKRRRNLITTGIAIVTLIVLLFVLVRPLFPLVPTDLLPNTLDRMLIHATSFEKYRDRQWLHSAAIAIWLHHPWFGAGLGSFPLLAGVGDLREYPHNIILELLCETGLVGALTFTILVAILIWQSALRLNTTRRGTAQVVLVLLVTELAASLVSSDINGNRWLFVSFGMAFALCSTPVRRFARLRWREGYAVGGPT